MIYLAYQQLNASEEKAYLQSKANIHTASLLISSHVEAAASKLYLLHDARSNSSFKALASNILNSTLYYSDILLVDSYAQQFTSIGHSEPDAKTLKQLTWRPISGLSAEFSISSVYQTSNNRWVFATRYKPNIREELWIEFDLQYGSSLLRGMRTLENGYLFVVDKTTGRLLFHPEPKRIGTASISYNSGIKNLIDSGSEYGTFEYYYKGQNKISAFDASNGINMVVISGTDRADIVATSRQFILTAIILVSLLAIIVSVNYLIIQLNIALSNLNTKQSIADYKHQLRSILDRFCHHKGVQFCLHNQDTGQFSTIDFHGNEQVIYTNKDLSATYTPKSDGIYYFGKRNGDALAQKLHITSRHYTIPLFNVHGLIAIIYMPMFFPTHRSLLQMIRNGSETALNNLLLNQKIQSKDVMTNLDNKLTIRDHIDDYLKEEHVYLALIDIDKFRLINDTHGHVAGDNIIAHTAKLMQTCFPLPKAISLARFSGEEFGILFKANDENHAYDLCEMLRHQVEKASLKTKQDSIKYTVSIGITSVNESQHSSIGRADKALYQAKGLGRNQVVLNTFQE
ncbi:diguanylate cyclase [Vibrio sp. ZSDE26]|uniref:diguanylate cyclase n=1 Tax=Vibrio amylolyticus TaxID=2847292 RepID=A0A9X2BHM6_9VIBR|nr:diguanylate cyclase [Vibrio amylolyticus]MCK6264141.1 diguanylate cyclase [Vibrio amylolyticus]